MCVMKKRGRKCKQIYPRSKVEREDMGPIQWIFRFLSIVSMLSCMLLPTHKRDFTYTDTVYLFHKRATRVVLRDSCLNGKYYKIVCRYCKILSVEKQQIQMKVWSLMRQTTKILNILYKSPLGPFNPWRFTSSKKRIHTFVHRDC
jgi:hypothetical protein